MRELREHESEAEPHPDPPADGERRGQRGGSEGRQAERSDRSPGEQGDRLGGDEEDPARDRQSRPRCRVNGPGVGAADDDAADAEEDEQGRCGPRPHRVVADEQLEDGHRRNRAGDRAEHRAHPAGADAHPGPRDPRQGAEEGAGGEEQLEDGESDARRQGRAVGSHRLGEVGPAQDEGGADDDDGEGGRTPQDAPGQSDGRLPQCGIEVGEPWDVDDAAGPDVACGERGDEEHEQSEEAEGGHRRLADDEGQGHERTGVGEREPGERHRAHRPPGGLLSVVGADRIGVREGRDEPGRSGGEEQPHAEGDEPGGEREVEPDRRDAQTVDDRPQRERPFGNDRVVELSAQPDDPEDRRDDERRGDDDEVEAEGLDQSEEDGMARGALMWRSVHRFHFR